jgi:iron complex outermembrane recepter protein
MKRFYFIIGALCLVLPLQQVLAEVEVQELSPIVVEARLDSLVPPYFPGNTTVIEEATINQSGARTVADLLVSHGGVQLRSFSGNAAGGTVSLRGFGENSSSRVLILVDGRPLNRPDMAAASLQEVPLSRIARVEILRGSQTARFGDQAVAGVINFVTKSADKPHSSVEVALGSDAYSLVRLAHDGRYAGNGVAFDFERNFSAGWRENSASELESAGLRWERELRKGTELRAGISWADEFTGFPGPLSEKEYRENPRQSIYLKSGQADQYFSQQTTQRADAGLRLGIDTDLSLDLPIAFSRSDQIWNLGPGFHSDNLLETWSATPVARLVKGQASAELGLTARREQLSLNQFAEISREKQTGHAELERDAIGGFTTAEWEPWTGWHLSAAARWQQTTLDAKAQSFVFPEDPALNFSRGNREQDHAYQLGIRWEPRTDLSLWLRYDSLYRLPSTDEIASYQGLPLSVPFNDQLKAETGHNLELGAEYINDGWMLRTNGFIQQLNGEIIYDYQKNLNVNFATSQRIGAEIDLSYQAKFWEANLHFTQLDASFQSGRYAEKAICLVPQQELSTNFSIHPHEHFTVQAEYQFTGASYEGNDFKNTQDKLPSYGVANLLLRYEPKPGMSFYARINNLLDESYATIKYSGVWYPAAGRTFQCGIRCEF